LLTGRCQTSARRPVGRPPSSKQAGGGIRLTFASGLTVGAITIIGQEAIVVSTERDRPKSLIGASIPRSGHHYLQNMLSRYYGDELYYCEFYNPPSCCKTIPCTSRGQHVVSYQKNHDRDLTVPQNIEGALYIVQYRHPVPEALSDRELDLRDGAGRRSVHYRRTHSYYLWWLAIKAVYYRRFHDKWLARRHPHAVYLNYDDLVRDPASALRSIIGVVSGSVDEARLSGTIDQSSMTRVSAGRLGTGAGRFSPRVVEKSEHFDPDLLGAFEAYIIERCPAYGFAQQLSGNFEGSPLQGLILLNDEDEPIPGKAQDRLSAAAELAPDHPEIQLRLANNEWRGGSAVKAMDQLEKLLHDHPFFTPAYRLLSTICKQTKQLFPLKLLTGDALLACAHTPDTLVDLGAALVEHDGALDAIAALALATIVAPENARAHHLLAVTLSKTKRWAQARHYAERALELEPASEASLKLMQNLARHRA
jgi:tetratricopeptide (TPR) repeat protein